VNCLRFVRDALLVAGIVSPFTFWLCYMFNSGHQDDVWWY
jgi:hypothetical protein